ncbi:hypothetical protein SAMN05444126_10116 [Salisediminibacterium halotolerans]|uniref:RNA polymerase sigma factor 70 region 1.1 domain-containing protein n=1 Tax=Salisediminibacterium halotolerans TaxID=517425 RepID=A0A1H9NXN7_9BACI|nr:hypothetical protein SAMN05444126_10116 [Salisediminibacterium haloalkalitolerans]
MLTREELIAALEDRSLTEALELIEDAENGDLTVLELVPSLGLLRDEELNKAVLDYLKQQGVELEYVDEES